MYGFPNCEISELKILNLFIYLITRLELTILMMNITDPMSLTIRLNLNSKYCKIIIRDVLVALIYRCIKFIVI